MAKAPKGAPARKPSAQSNPAAQNLDKFGLMLTIVVLLAAIYALFGVTSPMGAATADTTFFGMSRGDVTLYEADASGLKVKSFSNSGLIAQGADEVDTALIEGGADKGLRVGDVLKMSGEGQETIQFQVTKVNPTTSIATIFHSIAGESVDAAEAEKKLYKRSRFAELTGNSVSRSWADQKVRQAVHEMRQ